MTKHDSGAIQTIVIENREKKYIKSSSKLLFSFTHFLGQIEKILVPIPKGMAISEHREGMAQGVAR